MKSAVELQGNQSLADLLAALPEVTGLPPNRLRDLRSAVVRVAGLIGEAPENVPLDLVAIGAKLAAISPAAAGITPKRLNNIRSDLMAAVRVVGLKPQRNSTLLPAWTELVVQLPSQRLKIGLSRLARFASANGAGPSTVDAELIAAMIAAVRDGTLHQSPDALHRNTAKVWNEAVAALPELGLVTVVVTAHREIPSRVEWERLPKSFREDVENYLAWCGGDDVFAEDARPRAFSKSTLKLRRSQIHTAVTALVQSGVSRTSVSSLADLVQVDAFKAIVRERHKVAKSQASAFNCDLAEALVQVAREWIKADDKQLTELKRITSKIPMPLVGLTAKNKRNLRQFDDPDALVRLRQLPLRLWSEVKSESSPTFRTLAKAQAALGIAMLTYMPLRLQNLWRLTFDIHIFLRDHVRSQSSLEIPAAEVKNKTELAFDIPTHIAKMLAEYRDHIVPKVIGRRPDRLFVRADGKPKSYAMVGLLIKTHLHKRAGIELTAHQFRHLSAKVVLDAEPGGFETVRQLLGHKNLKTTVNSYAGIDSRRAGRHHQQLIDNALAQASPYKSRYNAARRRSPKSEQ